MPQSNSDTWKVKLPSCFGNQDLKFARHPKDAGRAKEMIVEAFKFGASTEDVLSSIRDYLTSQNASPEHVHEELSFAETFLKKVK
jgi:hypothetical protein